MVDLLRLLFNLFFTFFTLLQIATVRYYQEATALSQYGCLGVRGLLATIWLQDLTDCLSSYLRDLADLSLRFKFPKSQLLFQEDWRAFQALYFLCLGAALYRLVLNCQSIINQCHSPEYYWFDFHASRISIVQPLAKKLIKVTCKPLRLIKSLI